MLAQLQERERKRKEEMAGLIQAMQEDDGETVAVLGRQLGLPRLPLAIRTQPAGTTVRVGGKILSKTPFVVNSYVQSIDDQYTIELSGYESLTMSPLMRLVAGGSLQT